MLYGILSLLAGTRKTAPRCGWLLPLCALCSWLCCSAICQKAASVSQNFMASTVPLHLAFDALIVCSRRCMASDNYVA